MLAVLAVGCGSVARHQSTPVDATEGGAGGAPDGDLHGLAPPVQPGSTSASTLGKSPVPCGESPTPSAALLRACVLQPACTGDWETGVGSDPTPYKPILLGPADCISVAQPYAQGAPACWLTAKNCAELGACFGSGSYAGQCPFDSSVEQFCDGSLFVDCTQSVPAHFFDCARIGANCVAHAADAGHPGIQTADCAVPDVPCAQDDADFRCAGSKRVRCTNGIAVGEDCASTQRTCVADAGSARCQSPAPTCDKPGTATCNTDGSANFCTVNDSLPQRLECARAGLSCAPDPYSTLGVSCNSPDCSANDLAACYEGCNGPVAQLCIGGKRLTVDCRDYGLRYCVGATATKVTCLEPEYPTPASD